ncbi:MAG: PrsW family glutamic-type intramembrane protease [bacterium]
MSELFKDPKTLLYAILGGAVPALFWLWFWLKEEDADNPEPKGLVAISFIIGAIMVIFAIALEKDTLTIVSDKNMQTILWAAIEELLKVVAISIIILNTGIVNEPIDYPMYFISCALGFAAFENFLYLIHPIQVNGAIVGALTGNLRFIGSTLLHAIATSMVGSALGLSFYIRQYRPVYLLVGIVLAISLHSVFNFFIMKGDGSNFLSVFGFLWVVTIINILIFEKLKRMGGGVATSQ